MKPFLLIPCIFLAVLLTRQLLAGAGLTADEARDKISAGTAILIDVREPAEWSDGVAEPALLLPMSDFNGSRKLWGPALDAAKHKQLIVYCASGARSAMVAAKLRKEGFQALNLGGFDKWRSAGLPTKTP